MRVDWDDFGCHAGWPADRFSRVGGEFVAAPPTTRAAADGSLDRQNPPAAALARQFTPNPAKPAEPDAQSPPGDAACSRMP